MLLGSLPTSQSGPTDNVPFSMLKHKQFDSETKQCNLQQKKLVFAEHSDGR